MVSEQSFGQTGNGWACLQAQFYFELGFEEQAAYHALSRPVGLSLWLLAEMPFCYGGVVPLPRFHPRAYGCVCVCHGLRFPSGFHDFHSQFVLTLVPGARVDMDRKLSACLTAQAVLLALQEGEEVGGVPKNPWVRWGEFGPHPAAMTRLSKANFRILLFCRRFAVAGSECMDSGSRRELLARGAGLKLRWNCAIK